ncbi:hypothetical protein IQ216_00230 [Cyanobium sp. LEGE 06143]|uniref:hypothetical protein n=1 Tax=Cyanobium sp. LEGE 06143 TaxID=945727 RepID=UPI001881A49A|nr:hypothetical protein [Cyanobium sp. LEGE 06143]MBE9171570.1 hypothetical protein [Cyanobium sp. LEGE 06143]
MPRPLGRAPLTMALISSALAAAVLAPAVLAPAALAEAWKSCAYNDQPIGCRDNHSADGRVCIVWEDGQAMTYRLVKEGFPLSTLRDSLGGTWERRVYVQGNAEFTNPANGNRIFVPLR